MGFDGGMEADNEEKKKKINEDVIVFLRKRSETNAPKYAACLKTFVDLQQKRRRAAAARRHSKQMLKRTPSSNRKRNELETSKTGEVTEHRGGNGEEETRVGKRRGEKAVTRSYSRSRSEEPSDRCGSRRRRRKSCGRRKRKRRRRSCGKRRRRRRKRSCSRRRRRRSCGRRRKKRRRRRRC